VSYGRTQARWRGHLQNASASDRTVANETLTDILARPMRIQTKTVPGMNRGPLRIPERGLQDMRSRAFAVVSRVWQSMPSDPEASANVAKPDCRRPAHTLAFALFASLSPVRVGSQCNASSAQRLFVHVERRL
jgi:hypothetical protein